MKPLIAFLLIVGQIVLPFPSAVFAGEDKPAGPPPAPKVKVNRTLPKVEPLDPTLRFSDVPTDAEFFRARVFEEPLVPMAGTSDPEENKALAKAVINFHGRTTPDDWAAITTFLETYPKSRWRPTLLLNLGIVQYWSGYFSTALTSWQEAWDIAKHDESMHGRAIADRAIGELAAMNSRVGRADRLEEIFEEIRDRDVRGPATVKLGGAREGLRLMRTKPGDAFRCGPYALDRIRAFSDAKAAHHAKIRATKSTERGLSLTQVKKLASDMDMSYQMAKRAPGAKVLFPAVAHWKVGHFAALVQEKAGRYLVQDPTFGDDIWVSTAALDDEASGYFLVPDGPLPEGWQSVGEAEGSDVWGKGHINDKDPKETECDDDKAKDGNCGGGNGMPVWDVHALLVSLTIWDAPLGYTPPKGPSIFFRVTYNQKEYGQPATFAYSNLGYKWTHNWLSFITDNPNNSSAALTVASAGGGSKVHSGFDAATSTFAPHREDRTVVRRISSGSAPRYEIEQPDGSKLVYARSDGAAGSTRRIFLSEVFDPQGNKATLTYDSYGGSLRLKAISDALGQVTTIAYGLADDPLKITQVTDPFGRSAHFRYNGATPRQLMQIEDVAGMRSHFTYGKGDFINSMATPYGTTRFTIPNTSSWYSTWAAIDIVDPMGRRERVEFAEHRVDLRDSGNVVPAHIGSPEHLSEVNTLYFDSRAVSEMSGLPWFGTEILDQSRPAAERRLAPEKPTKVIAWQVGADGNEQVAAGTKLAVKQRLENPVWYTYNGQADATFPGATDLPNRISRVVGVDTQGTQLSETHEYEYNIKGLVTRYTDPVGRETFYEYAGNGIDLTAVKQKNSASYDLLWSATYNGKHAPLTITDASGQTTTLTYNAAGQLETITTPARAGVTENRTTTLVYDVDGYVQSITGPVPGSTASFTYDGYGRLRTLRNSDSYIVTLAYDALDRPSRVDYPNGTYESVAWNKLDVDAYRDVMGRVTGIVYDAVRRPISIRDPLGRTTSLVWCGCGGLERLIDANGNATSFDRDAAGRVMRETRADGSYLERTYQSGTSRVGSVADRRARRLYTYNIDGSPSAIEYRHTTSNQPGVNTPPVSFTYDPAYRRLATRTDRTGITTYHYNPVAVGLGSGRLASIDGPLPNDTIGYGYDEVGRIVRCTVNDA